MQINQELGQEIIRRLAEYIDVDINIMDLAGRIVASTDPERLDEQHSGALQVIRTGEPLILTNETHQHYVGTKPGVNLPIMHQNRINGVVGVSGEPEAILRITGLIRVSVEIVLEQIYLQQQTFYKERQWANWFHQLMDPAGYEKDKLIDEASYWSKCRIDQEWRVLVITGVQEQALFESIQEQVSASGLELLFILPVSEEEIILVTFSPLKKIGNFMGKLDLLGGQLGVGEEGKGLSGIRQSYQQAKQALDFNAGQEKITFSSDWHLKRLAVAIPDGEYIRICAAYEERMDKLDPLYHQTLIHYFALNCSNKESAEALHIHRNTLQYRLEQITEKVGLNPRVFNEAFLLQLILQRLL